MYDNVGKNLCAGNLPANSPVSGWLHLHWACLSLPGQRSGFSFQQSTRIYQTCFTGYFPTDVLQDILISADMIELTDVVEKCTSFLRFHKIHNFLSFLSRWTTIINKWLILFSIWLHCVGLYFVCLSIYHLYLWGMVFISEVWGKIWRFLFSRVTSLGYNPAQYILLLPWP